MSIANIVARVFQLEQELAREIKNLKTAMDYESIASELEQEPMEQKEKPKRQPNAWVRFTQRLDALFKSQELKVGGRVCLLFASHLRKMVPEAELLADEAVLEHYKAWTPPPRSTKSTESDAEGSVTKEKKGWSEEAKASAAAKRAAKKAATADSDSGSVTKERKPWSEEAKASAAAKRAAKKAAAAPAAAAAAPVNFNLKFETFSYEGEDCWQNERGDTLSPDGFWMGRFEGGKLNTSVAQPGDVEPHIAELMED
jgi:hypothetical protein